jgi:hypothetical protein
MWWFIIIWSFLLILVYYYIGLRLIKPLSLKRRDKRILWILLILVPVSQPLSLMLRQVPTGDILRIILGWISYTGFGIFSLILAGLLIRDFFLLISFILKKVLAAIKKLQYVKILLAHQPKSIFEAARAGFDLQLSGHTHGGQYIPWKYLVTLSQPYIQGLHRHGQTWVYVNRGTGYWGPPLRLGVPSEVTKISLRSV